MMVLGFDSMQPAALSMLISRSQVSASALAAVA